MRNSATIDKKQVADTSDRELVITRLINAPVEMVYEVWTNPDHLKNWFGPDGFTNTIIAMDVQPGGVWTSIMHGPDGKDYKNKSIFREVVKNKRLSYSHVSGPKFEATVDFEKRGDKTFLLMRMVFASTARLEKTIKEFGADEGLKQTIARLEKYVQSMKIQSN